MRVYNLKFLFCFFFVISFITSKYSHKDLFQSIKNLPVEKQFSLWAVYHDRNYDVDEVEANKRLQIFKSNLDFIEKENSKNLGFKLGLGPFSDLTFEEFSSKFSKINKTNKEELSRSDDVNPYPKSTKDWSSHFNVVKDWKNCDTGLEALLSLLEFELKQQFNDYTELSAQNYIDCYNGCEHFGIDSVLKISKELGFFPLSEYPFTGKFGVCKANLYYDSFNKCDKNDPYVLLEEYDHLCSYNDRGGEKVCKLSEYESILNKKPYLTIIEITPQVQHYTDGILKVNCKRGLNERNKEVYGVVTKMDPESAKVLMPFGNSYGEHGFLRMERLKKSESVFDRLCGPEGHAYTFKKINRLENRNPLK